MQSDTKTCFKCERSFPIEEFYVHSEMADGHLGKCKQCTKADVREHRQEHQALYKVRDGLKSKTPAAKARQVRYKKRSRAMDKKKWAARQIAGRALKRGQLKQRPCYFCGTIESIEMHHPDYGDPLRVYWLCTQCHRRLDSMYAARAAEA